MPARGKSAELVNTSQSITSLIGMARQTIVMVTCEFQVASQWSNVVILDAYSKWVKTFPLISATFTVFVQCMWSLFARCGLPDTLVSDNATCHVSAEFNQFLECNGTWHMTSSPYHPASNGLVQPMYIYC